MRPNDLASELGISGKRVRDWLRSTYPRSPLEHGARWYLTTEQVAAVREGFMPGRDSSWPNRR